MGHIIYSLHVNKQQSQINHSSDPYTFVCIKATITKRSWIRFLTFSQKLSNNHEQIIVQILDPCLFIE